MEPNGKCAGRLRMTKMIFKLGWADLFKHFQIIFPKFLFFLTYNGNFDIYVVIANFELK